MSFNVSFYLPLLFSGEMRIGKNLLFNVLHEQGGARG
jgi:hypothetical protein